MDLKSTLKQPIDYGKIHTMISPWIDILRNKKKYDLFLRGFSSLLEKSDTLSDLAQQNITLFLFFTLLPYFYKPVNDNERIFLELLKKQPTLDLEQTVEKSLFLFYTTIDDLSCTIRKSGSTHSTI